MVELGGSIYSQQDTNPYEQEPQHVPACHDEAKKVSTTQPVTQVCGSHGNGYVGDEQPDQASAIRRDRALHPPEGIH